MKSQSWLWSLIAVLVLAGGSYGVFVIHRILVISYSKLGPAQDDFQKNPLPPHDDGIHHAGPVRAVSEERRVDRLRMDQRRCEE